MAPTLTRADVSRIAALAHLELTDAEVELFTTQLAGILEYARQVNQVDTTGIAPTSHAFADVTAWREDEPVPCLPRTEAMANAPDADAGASLFRVPKVL